jgi:hypothetical protein
LAWRALDLSFGRAVYTGFTLGDLKVSTHGAVSGAGGASIPSLYAAGACASNIAQDSARYAPGATQPP